MGFEFPLVFGIFWLWVPSCLIWICRKCEFLTWWSFTKQGVKCVAWHWGFWWDEDQSDLLAWPLEFIGDFKLNDFNGVVRIKEWLEWIQEGMEGEKRVFKRVKKWESNWKGMLLLIGGCLESYRNQVSWWCVREWPSHIWKVIFCLLTYTKLKAHKEHRLLPNIHLPVSRVVVRVCRDPE